MMPNKFMNNMIGKNSNQQQQNFIFLLNANIVIINNLPALRLSFTTTNKDRIKALVLGAIKGNLSAKVVVNSTWQVINKMAHYNMDLDFLKDAGIIIEKPDGTWELM